jgi:hypothetical protein
MSEEEPRKKYPRGRSGTGPRPPRWGPGLILRRLEEPDGKAFVLTAWLEQLIRDAAIVADSEVQAIVTQMSNDIRKWRKFDPEFKARWNEVRYAGEALPTQGQVSLDDREGNEDLPVRFSLELVALNGNFPEAARRVGMSPQAVRHRLQEASPYYDERWVHAVQAANEELVGRKKTIYGEAIDGAKSEGDHRTVGLLVARELETLDKAWDRRNQKLEVSGKVEFHLKPREERLAEAARQQQIFLQQRQQALPAAPLTIDEPAVVDAEYVEIPRQAVM